MNVVYQDIRHGIYVSLGKTYQVSLTHAGQPPIQFQRRGNVSKKLGIGACPYEDASPRFLSLRNIAHPQ